MRWRSRSDVGGERALASLRGTASLRLLDACADAVLGVDGRGCVVFANAAAHRLFTAGRTDLTGVPADRLVPHLADAVHAVRRRHREGDRRPGPVTEPAHLGARRVDGSVFRAGIWLTPVPLRRGLLVAATVRDLTPRYETEALEQDLRAQLRDHHDAVLAVLGAVADTAMVMTDADGRITAVNDAASALLDYPADELLGRPSLVLSDPEQVRAAAGELQLAPGLDPALEAARAGSPGPVDWTWLTRDGEHRAVTLRVHPVGHPRPSGFVCVATERVGSWASVLTARTGSESVLLGLDDAHTRALSWQVGGGGSSRKR